LFLIYLEFGICILRFGICILRFGICILRFYFLVMLKIGLTGGIGSGKTIIAKIFEVLNIPVYYADDAAKNLMNNNEELKTAIIKNFGKESYRDGELDRKYLAGIVFSNKEKLDLLNSLTHPVTIQDAEQWMNRQTTPYIIKEAALLFESGAAERLDYVIGIYTPQHIRVKRVMDRDGLPAEDIMKRISRQIDEEMKMKLCDFVITNNEERLVIPQVLELDKKFRDLAAQ
jgi:dephospho-CoA kinase